MVHGACKSVGCFAMTDRVIDEIYGLVGRARGGQHEVPVHIFPFRMTDTAFAKETQGDWTTFCRLRRSISKERLLAEFEGRL